MKGITSTVITILILCFTGNWALAAQYKPGEVIVKFRPGSTLANNFVSPDSDEADLRPIRVAVDNVADAVNDLGKMEDVEYVEPDYMINVESLPDDWPYNDDEWQDVDFLKAWDLIDQSASGEEVIVAVVDSGVDIDHPELAGMFVGGYDFANNDSEPEDNAGHGTKVCGIIGAQGNNGEGVAGVDWDIPVKIMPLKFMEEKDGDCNGYVSDAIDAIYYAVDHGANIINASWGFDSFSYALQDAIKYADDHGVLFIASAGNSAEDNDTNQHYPSNYDLDNIIAVAAMDRYGELASFSNYGLYSVDIAAPGVGIVTTTIDDGYVNWASGTSFATPFVTSIAALVESQYPLMAYRDVKNRIIKTSVMSDDYSEELLASGGCINAYNALVGSPTHDLPSENHSVPAQSSNNIGSAPALIAGEGGGGGGGLCVIEISKKASAMSVLLIFIIILGVVQALGLRPRA